MGIKNRSIKFAKKSIRKERGGIKCPNKYHMKLLLRHPCLNPTLIFGFLFWFYIEIVPFQSESQYNTRFADLMTPFIQFHNYYCCLLSYTFIFLWSILIGALMIHSIFWILLS